MSELEDFIAQMEQEHPGSRRELVKFPSGAYMLHFFITGEEYVLAYLPQVKGYGVGKVKNITQKLGWRGLRNEFTTFQGAKQFAFELFRRALIGCVLAVLSMHGLRADTPSAGGAPKLEVGPFCPSAPSGITMLVDRNAAFVINPAPDALKSKFSKNDEALVPYGTTAPDGTYFTTVFHRETATIHFTWGRLDDHSVGAILTTDTPVVLPILLLQPWSGCKTVYWKEGDGVNGYGIGANAASYTNIQIRTQPAPDSVTANYDSEGTIKCALSPAQPTVLVASIGDLPAFEKVPPALEHAAQVYADRRIHADGDWGDFPGAIADVMNGSRLFSSLDRRLAHVVGRGWWIYHQPSIGGNCDLGPYFGWDSFLNGDMASLEDPEAAKDTVRAVLSLQTPDGMIGNFSHWGFAGTYVSADRSDPPIGALCTWKIYERWPDTSFLAEVYPKLVKWHDWWHTKRARKDDFLLSWGSNKGEFQGARWETGWDDTPSFAGAQMDGTCLNAYAVDLNALWAMDADYLARMADALGRSDDAARFRGEHDRMVKEINDRLWNEALGLYCDRMWQDNADGTPNFLTRISPMNFYPLICGAPDPARAARVLDYLHQPGKFWGQWLVPTLAYDDPDWKKQEYWNGHTWAPVNYLLWQGLKAYDDPAHQAQFVQRSVDLFMRSWKTDQRICSENYRSSDGSPDDDPHYTWGALLPLVGVEALVDIDPKLKPIARKIDFQDHLVLHHIPIGGLLYRIETNNGVVSVERE